jgi:hypothetical protein
MSDIFDNPEFVKITCDLFEVMQRPISDESTEQRTYRTFVMVGIWSILSKCADTENARNLMKEQIGGLSLVADISVYEMLAMRLIQKALQQQ